MCNMRKTYSLVLKSDKAYELALMINLGGKAFARVTAEDLLIVSSI